ncbi:hypothetical protein K523DRAFT_246372, partial [Schizophyllum commune Tattone D]
MPSTTVVDSDQTESTYRIRKLQALQALKQGKSFLKFPSGSIPLPTRHNPKVYGHLWPTLFPYGVGMMGNNEVRSNDAIGYRQVDLKTHVAHLLQSGTDRRFQTHLSYIFVMNNIMMRTKTSYSTNLAVKKPWFPKVDMLYSQIGDTTIETFQDKLRKNPFAKPESEGEQAAATLINYVNIVAEHIPGSMGDVEGMRRELFSTVNTDGIPHLFCTLNVSETNSPVAAVMAGRDIDLDKFFDSLSPSAENIERSTLLAQNPVAAAQFFHLSVRNLLGILLG